MSDESISNLDLINHIRDELLNLKQLEKFAAMVLASRRNSHTIQCNPSFNTIARDMSVTRRSAINAINGLIEQGIIKRIKRDSYNHYLFYWDLEEVTELSENVNYVEYSDEELSCNG